MRIRDISGHGIFSLVLKPKHPQFSLLILVLFSDFGDTPWWNPSCLMLQYAVICVVPLMKIPQRAMAGGRALCSARLTLNLTKCAAHQPVTDNTKKGVIIHGWVYCTPSCDGGVRKFLCEGWPRPHMCVNAHRKLLLTKTSLQHRLQYLTYP